MTQLAYVVLAAVSGGGIALQASMLAEASYLAAQGVLARDFALRTAATAFERLRLATLGRHGQLAYFSGREDER